jgi:ADP-heptose:LPS heptosyltransferase
MTAPAPPASGQGQANSLAVVQLARLGDFLQTTPLLAGLRARHPRATLAAVVAPAQAPLARACRFVDEVMVADPACLLDAARAVGEPRRLRRARLLAQLRPLWSRPQELVYNLNLSDLASLLAAGWPGARLAGWRPAPPGVGGRPQGAPWTAFVMALLADRRLTRLHLADILASYAEPAGPPLAALDFQVDGVSSRRARELLGRSGAAPRVVLQLGANNDLRRWPVESFAGLAQGLLAQGVSLVLVGSSAESPLAAKMKAQLGPAAATVRDLMGRTDLTTLAGVLQGCDLVVSADTGTLHLATAVGARCLSLYMGPAQVHETGPYGVGHLVLQARDQCGPCQEHRPACAGAAPCRRLIGPGAALAASLGLLAGTPPARVAQGLDLPEGVEPLLGAMDAFGQLYRSLRPGPLRAQEGLALALREAGRTLLRPAYAPEENGWAGELGGERQAPAPAERAALETLAQVASALAQAAATGDALAARRLAARAPGLAPLAAQVGPQAPPRLAPACRLAAGALEAASSL